MKNFTATCYPLHTSVKYGLDKKALMLAGTFRDNENGDKFASVWDPAGVETVRIADFCWRLYELFEVAFKTKRASCVSVVDSY